MIYIVLAFFGVFKWCSCKRIKKWHQLNLFLVIKSQDKPSIKLSWK